MTTEQQDTLWACLPKEVREEKRKEYRIVSKNPRLDRGDSIYLTALDNIFGHHNLTSDTEPEELLHISRQSVIDKYAEIFWNKAAYLDSSPEAMQCQACLNVLKSLFGDKCLTDKETEYSKQRFRVHDKVMFNDNLCQIIGTDYDNKEFQLKRISDNHLMGWANESALEPYVKEPSVQVEPRFKVGDKVRIIKQNHSLHGKTAIVDVPMKDAPEILVNRMGNLYSFYESELEPYAEPETKDAYEQYKEAEAEKYKNQLKDMEEKELNRKALYDAMYELEIASIKVRKALISM